MILTFIFFNFIFAIKSGILLSIPLPFELPTPQIQFPFLLDNIVIRNVQFHNIQINSAELKLILRSINDKLNLEINLHEISINFYTSLEEAHFVHYYEEELVVNLQVKWQKQNFIVTNSKIRSGFIHVYLGPHLKEIIFSSVIEFILFQFSPVLHYLLSKIIKKKIQDLGKQFLFENCFKHICIDLELLEDATIEQNTLRSNINGVFFLQGQQKQILVPQVQLMVKDKSQLQLLIAQQVLSSLLLTIAKSQFNYAINTLNSTNVISLNTQSLSNFFPQMVKYDKQNVKFVYFPQPGLVKLFEEQMVVSIEGIIDIFIGKQNDLIPYISHTLCKTQIKIGLLADKTSIKITDIDINLQFNKQDIEQNKVNPEQCQINKCFIKKMIIGVSNGQIYKHHLFKYKLLRNRILGLQFKDKYLIVSY